MNDLDDEFTSLKKEMRTAKWWAMFVIAVYAAAFTAYYVYGPISWFAR